MSRPPVRLFVDAELVAGGLLTLTREQSHYLSSVMRLAAGDTAEVFNGRSGGWRAELVEAGRKAVVVKIDSLSCPQETSADLWLLFAPIKRGRIDWLAEKACELGISRLVPVLTERTIVRNIAADRLVAHMIEAAEQCGRTAVPALADAITLPRLLASWPAGRSIFFCDESGGAPLATTAAEHRGPVAVLTGPEGGFAPAEAALLRAHRAVVPVSLGPRILRADTAAVAALSIVQALMPDGGNAG